MLATAPTMPAAEFVWATPSRAVAEGRPYTEFIQPTESGLPESGMFGCVRSSGAQFHEGIDLAPVARDKRGEPTDDVYALLPGAVRHANATGGLSTYGRYIVIEHTDGPLAFVSLYAHLARIAPGVQAGANIAAGTTLGVMGRSATYSIPRERAHLHLEVGFYLSRDFQRWYDRQKFPDKNDHGIFNGRNIVGLDFLDFVERRRAGQVNNMLDYVQRLPTAVTVLVRQGGVPDFVARHPVLLSAPVPADGVAAWLIEFTWYGLPRSWRPLNRTEAAARSGNGNEVVFHDRALLDRFPCQSVVRMSGGRPLIGERLEDYLAILFAGP